MDSSFEQKKTTGVCARRLTAVHKYHLHTKKKKTHMKILCARFSPIHNLFIYVTYRSALNRNDGTWNTPYTNVNNIRRKNNIKINNTQHISKPQIKHWKRKKFTLTEENALHTQGEDENEEEM